MAQRISITSSKQAQLAAARALSTALDTLGIKHAIFGGFALALYGSLGHTDDIDVLVDLTVPKIQGFLRPQVSKIDKHFAQLGLKYYFVPMLVDGLEGEQLVLANRENVLVETLPTGSLGLPSEINSGIFGSSTNVCISPS